MARLRIGARRLMLAATFAAVYVILRAIPTFRMTGLEGASFSAGDLVLTSMAMILDPVSAVLAVLVGTFIGFTLRSPIFLGLDFLPSVVHVLVVGFTIRKRRRVAGALFGGVTFLWAVHPYSLLFPYPGIPFFWLHVIAILVLVSPVGGKVSGVLDRPIKATALAWMVAMLSFVGTMSQHITGGVLFETVIGALAQQDPQVFAQIWIPIFWLYPVERTMVILFSTLLGTAIVRAMQKSKLNF
jgi:hypothetical protein